MTQVTASAWVAQRDNLCRMDAETVKAMWWRNRAGSPEDPVGRHDMYAEDAEQLRVAP